MADRRMIAGGRVGDGRAKRRGSRGSRRRRCVQVMVVVVVMVMGRVVRMLLDDGGGGAHLVAQNPRDARDGRHVVLVADAVGEQPVADLPGEDAGILELELLDVLDDLGRGDAGLATADRAGQDAAGLVEARQDLAHAAVADAELARYVAGSDAQPGQIDDARSHGVRQRSAVHKNTAELVHFTVLLLLLLLLVLVLVLRLLRLGRLRTLCNQHRIIQV